MAMCKEFLVNLTRHTENGGRERKRREVKDSEEEQENESIKRE